MFLGSLILGFTVIAFAAWLQWNEVGEWPSATARTALDREYLATRTRARKRIHALIAISGLLILIAAFAGPGPVWLGAWLGVMALLVTVVFLAGLDALRTHRYHVRKLPEIRREILGDHER
jgi:hypothetical protein